MNDQITITLGRDATWTLAKHFAQQIHDELIRRHLRRVGYTDGPSYVETRRREHAEMCEAIRSLGRGGYGSPRREFVLTLKFLFRELMTEERTERRWQTYVQSVAKVHGMPAPAAIDDPAWETFVLKQPHGEAAAA